MALDCRATRHLVKLLSAGVRRVRSAEHFPPANSTNRRLGWPDEKGDWLPLNDDDLAELVELEGKFAQLDAESAEVLRRIRGFV